MATFALILYLLYRRMVADRATYIYANMFVAVPTATTVEPTDGSYTNFILANDEVKGVP